MKQWLRTDKGSCTVFITVGILVLVSQALARRGSEWRQQRVWEQSRPRLIQDLRTLDPVLHALEQYRLDHPTRNPGITANYPATLQDLVPGYLRALPTLPPDLRGLRYKQINVNDSLMPLPPPPPTLPPDPSGSVDCKITIPLGPRSLWRDWLRTEPEGTLVYTGLNPVIDHWRGSIALMGRPTDRIWGWEYYPTRRWATGTSVFDARQAAAKPYREARLKTLQPLVDALDKYWRDHVDRPDHPPTYPPALQALVPDYLPALPKLAPVFGPLPYEKAGYRAFVWVRLNEQVVDAAGKPLDISCALAYSVDGSMYDILLDKSDPNSRPMRRVNQLQRWALYD